MGFNEEVWRLCSKIPKGKVTTYKAIAQALDTRAYRAVGNAMNKNPRSIVDCQPGEEMIPCHRVVDSQGRLHGFAHGLKKKEELLREEGIQVVDGKIDLAKYFYDFSENGDLVK